MNKKKIKLILIITIVVIIGIAVYFILINKPSISPAAQDYVEYSLEFENSDGHPFIDVRKILYGTTQEGTKKIIIENIALLEGYPQYEIENFVGPGLKLIGYSPQKIIAFAMQQGGGGVFHSPVFVLDLKQIDNGFHKVENFITIANLRYIDNTKSKIIGASSEKNSNKLLLLDLNKSSNPILIYTSPPGKTFFFPSFYGDDEIDISWQNNIAIEIQEYDKTSLDMINPNEKTPYPSPQIKTISIP